mmetsp:Transcript_33170/g.48442  ORF Transcript_33170/g.48442 Transcript_33170/m.48442 type:complete len:116 (+) Transcript_33170:223-570(+)
MQNKSVHSSHVRMGQLSFKLHLLVTQKAWKISFTGMINDNNFVSSYQMTENQVLVYVQSIYDMISITSSLIVSSLCRPNVSNNTSGHLTHMDFTPDAITTRYMFESSFPTSKYLV